MTAKQALLKPCAATAWQGRGNVRSRAAPLKGWQRQCGDQTG